MMISYFSSEVEIADIKLSLVVKVDSVNMFATSLYDDEIIGNTFDEGHTEFKVEIEHTPEKEGGKGKGKGKRLKWRTELNIDVGGWSGNLTKFNSEWNFTCSRRSDSNSTICKHVEACLTVHFH